MAVKTPPMMPPMTMTGIRSASQADRLVESIRRAENTVVSPIPRRRATRHDQVIWLRPIRMPGTMPARNMAPTDTPAVAE